MQQAATFPFSSSFPADEDSYAQFLSSDLGDVSGHGVIISYAPPDMVRQVCESVTRCEVLSHEKGTDVCVLRGKKLPSTRHEFVSHGRHFHIVSFCCGVRHRASPPHAAELQASARAACAWPAQACKARVGLDQLSLLQNPYAAPPSHRCNAMPRTRIPHATPLSELLPR